MEILNKFKFSPEFLRFNLIGTIVNEKEPKYILKKFKDVIEYLEIDLDTFYIEIDPTFNPKSKYERLIYFDSLCKFYNSDKND